MLEFIKVSEENKSSKEFVDSANYCNEIIKQLSDINNKIENNIYSKDFSFLLNKYEDDIKNNDIISSQDKKTLLRDIDTIFNKLNELKNLKHRENSDFMAKEVDRAVDISKNHENFKEAKNMLIEIQKEFEKKYIHPESHEYLWSVLQDAFTRLKKREKVFFSEQKKQWEENYKKLSSSLESAISNIKEDCDLYSVKSSLIKVQKSFKGLSLERSKQQELWTKLQNSFEKLKKIENDFIEKNKENWDNNFRTLTEKLNEIDLEVNNKEYSRKIWDSLKAIQDSLKIKPIGKENEEEVRNKIQSLFDILKLKQKKRNEEIAKLKEGGYDKLDRLTNRALNEASTNKNLEDVFEKLKAWQKNIFEAFYISKEEKNTLLEKINKAFEIYKERKEKEKKLKRQNWIEKQKRFLETISNKKYNLENITLPRIEEEITQLKDKFSNAQDEEKEKLASILENKLSYKKEITDKINELKGLIEEVNTSLSK